MLDFLEQAYRDWDHLLVVLGVMAVGLANWDTKGTAGCELQECSDIETIFHIQKSEHVVMLIFAEFLEVLLGE